MSAFRTTSILLVAILAVACSEYGAIGPTPISNPGSGRTVAVPSNAGDTSAAIAALGRTPLAATIQFGQPNAGSPFPPPEEHDQSAHAADNLVPRTVVIDKGGTVTFKTFGVHQVSIYDSGTEPEDIDTSVLVLTPEGCPKPMGTPLMINDSTDRLALYAQPCGPGPRQVEHKFNEPGRYLVICAFLPHFQVQMYGWVIVRE